MNFSYDTTPKRGCPDVSSPAKSFTHREIYASGGDLLMAPINAQELLWSVASPDRQTGRHQCIMRPITGVPLKQHIIIVPEHDFPSAHPARWESTRFIGGQQASWHDPRQRWACSTETSIRCIVCILCDTLLPCDMVFCTYHTIFSSWVTIHTIKAVLTNAFNQGDHSPDNVKFPDISLTVPGTPPCH